MRLVLAFYDAGLDALEQGADTTISKLPVREQIGRYKYTKEDQLAREYEKVTCQGQERLQNSWERRACKNAKRI